MNIENYFTKRNMFYLSHDVKFDCDMGQLIPILCKEVLPGDTWRCHTDIMVRALPLVGPTYHDIEIITRFFFVPNRLIWTDWEKFITGGPDGKQTAEWPHYVSAIAKYDLGDYFGFPIANPLTFSALPYRAYAKIYNDWFLDQTLGTPISLSTASGVDVTTNGALLNVAWEKDYFTSALPNAQRGDPVTLGLGTSAPVTIPNTDLGGGFTQLDVIAADGASAGSLTVDTGDGDTVKTANTGAGSYGRPGLRGNGGTTPATRGDLTGTADLTSATAVTINDLRLATQIQRFLERLARSGARYIEYILAMFGVKSQDARLQRAEYLGGGKSKLIISEVLQTSETATTPQGTLAGHGFSLQRSKQFKKGFTEHGLIVGLMYILPKTAYQEGLPREFSRTSKWDYYVPLLAHLGEQAILKKELYYNEADGDNEEVFGYTGRWDEMRRCENRVAGDFRNPTGLGLWCLTRIFGGARPTLTNSFILSDPSKRIFADTGDRGFAVYLKHNIKAIRPLPKIASPGYMDH